MGRVAHLPKVGKPIEHLLLKVVGAGISHEALIGIEGRDTMLQCVQFGEAGPELVDASAKVFHVSHSVPHSAHRPIDEIDAPGHDHTADKLHSVLLGLDIHLVLMQFQVEVFPEPQHRLLIQLDYHLLG